MFESQPKDPWLIAAKLSGAGAIAYTIREILRRIWPTKEKSMDVGLLFTEKLLARIDKLEREIDVMKADYEKRLQILRDELDTCRNQCRKLQADATLLGRFIPPER